MSGEMSQWVWDTMLSMTILMALVLLLRKPVSHFFGPNIAYLLWILPVARLFMPTLTLEAPAPVENVSTFIPSPVGAELLTSGSTAAASSSALASLDWMLIGLILWLGCAGLLFISKLASYMQFREDIVADGRLVGRHGNIKILETAAVGGPLAFGVIEKYIAVPTNFFRDYAPRERELSHLERTSRAVPCYIRKVDPLRAIAEGARPRVHQEEQQMVQTLHHGATPVC